MEFNYLHLMWIFFSFIVTLGGVNVLFRKNIPSVLVRLCTYGKAHKKFIEQNSIVKWFEIPKRCFSHFYVFAVAYFFLITGAVLLRYFGNVPSPFFVQLLNLIGSYKRESTVSAESVVILSIVLFLQACRRCYETFYVSVYSDTKMNILHYILGLKYYFGVGLSLLHDAPGFENENDYFSNYISGIWLTFPHFLGVVVILEAFNLQFKAHKSLASLRKKDGKISSTGHYLPTSVIFEFVSCPHYFAEILIYLSACIILSGKSYSWWLVCLFTVSNQIIAGIMNHQWYKKTFKHYPVKRKAVIPFLI